MAIGDHNHTLASFNSTSGGQPFITTTTNGMLYTSPAPVWDPCVSGHEGDPDQAEYLDGLVATTCVTCGARMTIKSVTGGIPHLRLKQFMEMLLGSPDHQDLLVKDFLDIQAVVDAEREKFKEVEALLDTARKIMRGEVDA